MKKILSILMLLVLSPFIAGLYGIANDQLSYTICPEYFTKFKFHQFGLIREWGDYILEHLRQGAALVGWSAAWWVGPPIALCLSLVSLIHRKAMNMFIVSLKALLLAMLVTFLSGLAGVAYGYWHLASTGVTWRLPADLIDTQRYIAVGSMHNFSYAGGLLGMLFGIAFIIAAKRKKDASAKMAA